MDRPVLICDIDHTIAASHWRDHLLGQWDAYHAEMGKDEAYEEVVALICGMKAMGWHIACLTARPEKWRVLTMEWLVAKCVPVDELLMRGEADFRPSPEMKLAMVKESFVPGEVKMVIDDREDIVAAFRGFGVTVLQAHVRKIID